jgi:membrane associated rhomboid family serine protease
MIPLRDNIPRTSTPVVTVGLIIVNTLIFLYQLTIPARFEESFIFTYSMVPARLTHALTAPGIPLEAALLPFVTSMFLHGGWMHLIGNMWFLWIFGDNVEDRLGHIGYLLFYLLCGLGAGLAHVIMNLQSTLPSLGASGAISGVLGAYIVMFPRARITTLVPLLIIFFTVQLPAVVILGYWFVIQILSGLGSVGGGPSGGVAWWAHIGGFLLGMILIRVWPKRPQPFRYVAGY